MYGMGGGARKAIIGIAMVVRKGGSVSGRVWNQQQAALGRGPAEDEWRTWLEKKGVVLVPKPNGSSPGPDAIYDSGTYLGWEFAELKPHNPDAIKLGTAQIYGRFDQGYAGPGALYTWEGSPGAFTFRQAGLITPPLTLGL